MTTLRWKFRPGGRTSTNAWDSMELAAKFGKYALIGLLLLAPLRLRGIEPTHDPVACCSEARAFLRSIGQVPTPSRVCRLEPSKKQLFIDDDIVSELNGVRRELHQPRKLGSVLRSDRPWEGTIWTETAPSWNPEKKLWMLWYGSDGGTAYATSQDGIYWEKPVLGVHRY